MAAAPLFLGRRDGGAMIQFDNVTKTYPDGSIAVGGISLHVPEGSTTVLLGSSGSGKTTLLRMVNAMVQPTSGRVLVAGEDVAGRDPVALRRSIGYVLQDGGLFPHRRVIDNIATVPLLEGTPKPQAHARAMELMELVGLDSGLARRFPNQLSGGQRQRVGVARALANHPRLLLMDEPFGALDPLVRADLQQELIDLQRRLGTTILFVTHDVEEAFLLGDQVAVLRPGGILAAMGTPADLMLSEDDFVARFVGTDQRRRRLTTVQRDGRVVVVDGDGRPVGTLAQGSGSCP